MEEDHEDYSYSSPPTTSMVDYSNTQPSWFQPHHSVQIQMDPNEQQHPLHDHLKYPTKPNQDKNSNVSRNHSELIEGLRSESNQSSRSTSRNAMRLIPDFIQDSKLVNRLFGSRSNSSQNSNLNTTIPQSHYQNYSNLKRQYSAQHHHQNANTFLLKTPTKKLRQPHTASILNDSTNQTDVSKIRSTQNQSLLVNNTPFSMNASSNASIGGNLNTTHNMNNFNTSLSATTMNHSQHLSSSNQNLVSNTPGASKARLQSNRKLEADDLTSSNDDQRYETTNRNHRNLRLNRASTLNQASSSTRYSNLPTAPVLPTFGSSSSASKTSRMSPLMNRLRNSFNFSSHHYRNLNKLSSRNKLRNSFSSAVSLKSKCDNPTSDQLVTPNGFHFPQSYIPPKNPNQYLPLHLRKSQESASALSIDQEKELNNNLNNALNLNKTNQTDPIDIKISPASRGSHRNLNAANEQQSLANVDEEENLIVMDDLSSNKDLNNSNEPDDKDEKNRKDDNEFKMRSSNSNYTISTAAAILNASNENELSKLKSSVKPNINNQDSQPLTSGTLTGGTLTENQSKSSSTHSSLTELNHEDHEESNENQSLLTKTNETSSSSNETTALQQQKQEQISKETEEDEENEDDKSYSPNEDFHEIRYEESPTSSNDSLSPYESNQNTVSSYTQLLEKDKK